MMVESDSDVDDFTTTKGGSIYQNETMAFTARGPNTGGSFRNNISSSTMLQVPRNFERHRFREPNYNQRSMYYESRRETSPMSIMSACDVRQRNFNNSYYPRAMSSHRSVVNGRSGSPMSVRSIDSSASVSATDIAMAFKSATFNKHDMRVIKEAYNKFMRHRVRKKIEKRRNLKHFLKGCRRVSGGDSGEQGSDSSLSSDDRSTKTSNFKDNMSSCRSTKTDITNFRRTIKESNMYKDCTDNFKNDSFRSTISRQGNPDITQNFVSSSKSMFAGSSMSSKNMPISSNFSLQKKPNSTMLQKERFQNGFLLPSQRFNRSIAATSIPEITENINYKNHLQNGKTDERNSYRGRNVATDSDHDENIFSDPIQQKNNNIQRKRTLESNEDIINLPNQKRSKLVSPCKNSKEVRTHITKETAKHLENNDKSNDFVFAKPTFPVRKSTKEKLLAKCNAPLLDAVVQESDIPICNKNLQPDTHEIDEEDQTNVTQSTDLSSRPSFIKRKLFTQKLDVSEKKNTSTDSSNSPQNSLYGAIQKEKHKARKLQQVMTQSCLSRDVQDESNLIDLIHKIVPREQMNVTSQTNKTDLQSSKPNDSEKWDVTSIISERKNEDDVSDTYTDEEIFNATVKEMTKEITNDSNKIQKKGNTPKKGKASKESVKENGKVDSAKIQAKEKTPKKPSPLKQKTCKVIVEKLPEATSCMSDEEINDGAYKKSQRGVKLFWDTTDVESDAECQPPRKNANVKVYAQEIQPKEASKFQGVGNKFNSKKLTTTLTNASSFLSNTTTDIIQKFNTSTLRIRSHRNPTRKNFDHTWADDSKSVMEPQSKKKIGQANVCIELSKIDPKIQIGTQNQKANNTVAEHTKPDNVKKCNCKTQTSKRDKNINSKKSPKKLTPKRQTERKNNKNKNVESESKVANDNKENVQSKYEIAKVNNKQKKTTPKSNNKVVDSTPIVENTKSTAKKTTAIKQKPNNNDQVAVENNQQNVKIDKKTKQSPNVKTKKQTKTNKKPTKTSTQNKKLSPKTKNTKADTIIVNDYSADDTLGKENTTLNRTLRSCRLAKLNSDTTVNETMSRTLRSRQIDTSTSTINANDTKSGPKTNTGKAESRLSDISFSLPKKKILPRRAITSRLHTNDVDSSDVSFSISAIVTPNAKRVPSSKLNSKAGKKQVNVSKTLNNNNSLQSDKFLEYKNELKPQRNRLPNKRYLNTSQYF